MGEPGESVTQEAKAVGMDEGAESFAVDKTIAPEEGTQEKEETTEETTPEDKSGEAEPKEGDEGEEGEKTKAEEGEPGEEGKEKEPAEGEEGEEGEEDLPKGVKKRLATITRKRREAERLAEALEAENEQLKQSLELKDTKEEPELNLTEPDIEDFDTIEEYEEAVIDYKADLKFAAKEKKRKEAEAEEAAAQQAEVQRERFERVQRALKKGLEKYEDFEDVMAAVDVTDDMITVMDRLPNTSDVAYYLGKHEDVTDELTEASFVDMTLGLKKISDDLKKKKTTKAPHPIRPVGSSSGGIKTPEQMNMAEYNAWRDKQEKARKGHY